jgi:hypothetical protein
VVLKRDVLWGEAEGVKLNTKLHRNLISYFGDETYGRTDGHDLSIMNMDNNADPNGLAILGVPRSYTVVADTNFVKILNFCVHFKSQIIFLLLVSSQILGVNGVRIW